MRCQPSSGGSRRPGHRRGVTQPLSWHHDGRRDSRRDDDRVTGPPRAGGGHWQAPAAAGVGNNPRTPSRVFGTAARDSVAAAALVAGYARAPRLRRLKSGPGMQLPGPGYADFFFLEKESSEVVKSNLSIRFPDQKKPFFRIPRGAGWTALSLHDYRLWLPGQTD
jgi:hypothetical protein